MIELLRQAAAEAPDQPAIVTRAGELTYSELSRRAEVVAAALRARGISRFGIVEPDPMVVWSLLAAASLAGAEACVYPVAATDEAVADIRARLQHDVVVGSRRGTGAIPPEQLMHEEPLDDAPPASQPVLVLTTGTTTGRPQAARHEWSRLLRVTDRIRPTPDQRWLLAYGINQFAGLQVLLHVAAARATLVVGESFQPRDGLAAMRLASVTHASGTPTFWRFLLAELRTDGGPTPDLQQVTLGGEAIPSAVLAQLRETFPQARISQLYASTEMGLSISVRDGRPGLPLSVLEEGAETELKVVDGELWVRSKAAMLGYHGQEPLEHGGWRATGDLVEVVDDRILFRGRKSDVINVGGVKIDPLPIEEVVSEVPGVSAVHAAGRPNRLVGQIVALEVVPAPGTDENDVHAAIQDACAALPPAARPRSIRFVPTLAMAGNKLSRGTHA